MNKLTNYLIAAFFIAVVFSCKKDEIAVVNTPITSNLTTIYQGTFTSSAHPTSGTVKLAKDAAGKKYLVFDSFKTDAGPDLRIYLSEDLAATNYTEITNKVTNGTYQLDVAATLDTDKKRKVLIWCKSFSVLFGSADLK
jgi:Electron transfer DM13